MGPRGDGGKWVCDPAALFGGSEAPCAVLSVGSNGDFRFEAAAAAYGCVVHVYDHDNHNGNNNNHHRHNDDANNRTNNTRMHAPAIIVSIAFFTSLSRFAIDLVICFELGFKILFLLKEIGRKCEGI